MGIVHAQPHGLCLAAARGRVTGERGFHCRAGRAQRRKFEGGAQRRDRDPHVSSREVGSQGRRVSEQRRRCRRCSSSKQRSSVRSAACRGVRAQSPVPSVLRAGVLDLDIPVAGKARPSPVYICRKKNIQSLRPFATWVGALRCPHNRRRHTSRRLSHKDRKSSCTCSSAPRYCKSLVPARSTRTTTSQSLGSYCLRTRWST